MVIDILRLYPPLSENRYDHTLSLSKNLLHLCEVWKHFIKTQIKRSETSETFRDLDKNEVLQISVNVDI